MLLPGINVSCQVGCAVEIDKQAQEFHKSYMSEDGSLLFADCADVADDQDVR